MGGKTPLRDRKKIGKLLGDKPAKGKKIPDADKGLFDRLTQRAAQPIAKRREKTSEPPNGGD